MAAVPRFVRPYTLIRLTWLDAGSSQTLLYEPQRDHKPIVMTTVGWVLRHDTAGISLANERFTEDGVTHYRGWTYVPAGMVDEIKRLPAV